MHVPRTLTPWQRILRAAQAGHGLRLTADEVFMLAQDSAIAARAVHDDEGTIWDAATPEGYVAFKAGGAHDDDWRSSDSRS